LDPHRQALDPVDEVAAHPAHVPGQLDGLQPRQQGLEHQPDLQPGQVVAEAEVRAALAEGDVVVGVPGHVELIRRGEDLGIPVARGEPHDDLVALADGLAV
jgi:hypothetical protein